MVVRRQMGRVGVGQTTDGSPAPTGHYDQLIPVAGVDAMVKTYCDAGAHINYNRIPTGDHIAVAATGATDALNYLVSALSGAATPTVPTGTVTCN